GADVLPYFSDALHGWAWSGDALVRTVDGGATWTALPLGAVAPGQLIGLRFAAANTGTAFDEETGLLSRSNDGGETWSVLPPPPAVQRPLPVWKPSPGATLAQVVMLSGGAEIDAGTVHSAARQGQTLSPTDSLDLLPSTTAEVGLPDGS